MAHTPQATPAFPPWAFALAVPLLESSPLTSTQLTVTPHPPDRLLLATPSALDTKRSLSLYSASILCTACATL